MKTALKNRILWFDGTNQVAPELVPHFILLGVPLKRIAVSSHNDDTKLFNQLNDEQLTNDKSVNDNPDLTWNIPSAYQSIDLRAHLGVLLIEKIPTSNDIQERYLVRLANELAEIEKRGMQMLVRTLIYVVDELKRSKSVWGVGRGSSCASLVLYLIGLHAVDPIKYNIPMSEFFHD